MASESLAQTVEQEVRVLVVDDDELFRHSIAGALSRRGYQVRQADSVASARVSLEEFQPECIFLDIRMPVDLGIELIAPVKELYPETRIVVLTGYGSIATAVAAMKLGADEYLTKPASLDELLAALEGRESSELALSEETATLSEVEYQHIQKVLLETGGNVSKAAKILGIHRRSLQRKLASLSGD